MSVTAVPIRKIKRGSVARLFVALAVLALAAAAIAWWGTAGQRWLTTPSGLRYRVVEAGGDARPAATDVVTFDYVGRLADGTVFDSSEGKGPAQIPVFGVVPGFAEGLQLMGKGGVFVLRIPPELGYGAQGQPPVIPPDATLDFEVTLRDFRALSAQEIEQIRMMQQMQGQLGGPGN